MCEDNKSINTGYDPNSNSTSEASVSDGSWQVTSVPFPYNKGWTVDQDDHVIGNDLTWNGDSAGVIGHLHPYYPPMPNTAHGASVVKSLDDEDIYILNIILGIVSVTQEEYRYFVDFHKFKTLEEAVMNKDIYGIRNDIRFGILLMEHMMNMTFNRSYSQTLDVAGFVRDWPSTLESQFFSRITSSEEFVRHVVDRMLYLQYIEKIRTDDMISDARTMYVKVKSIISSCGDNDN